jgi:hypothetical protein
MTIRWYGLVAPEEVPTGDRRMFAAQALGYRDFPLPAAWQRVSGSGHSGSIVVASWDRSYAAEGGIWGEGTFLDPTVVPEALEAMYLLQKKLIGPSVDLDPDLTYEIVTHPSNADENAFKVTKATVHGVTFVMGPAFPQVHITVTDDEEMSILASAGISATFAVNRSAWRSWPIATRETTWNFEQAVSRIAEWSGGDPKKYAQAFLYQDKAGNPSNRESYRLPIADVSNGELVLVPRGVMSAANFMSAGHGGLEQIPDADRTAIQEVLTEIYDVLRDQYGDPRFIAPWQRGGRAGATSADAPPTEASMDPNHWSSHDETAFQQAIDYWNNAQPTREAMEAAGVTFEPLDDEQVARIKAMVGEYQSRLDGPLEDYWVRGEGAAKIRWGTPGSFDRCVRALRSKFPQNTEGLCANLHHEATGKWPAEGKDRGDNSITAAGVLYPKAAWFADPKLNKATPLTITDDGRVFGHLAAWGTCHLGVGNKCTMVPKSATNYRYFHLGTVKADDGSLLPTGKITLGTGHADMAYGVRPATEHYDNTGTCAAVVRAGEDAYGVWVAGSLVADISENKIAELRRSPLSGDWRRVNGNLELVAALAVNDPGFAVAHDDPNGVYSLVAASVPAGGESGLVDGHTEAFAQFDEFLDFADRTERRKFIESIYHEMLPGEEGCGCN